MHASLRLIVLAVCLTPLAALDAGSTVTSDLTLTEDLVLDETGDGLVVGANGITIDGGGHALICTGPMGLENASHDSTTVAGIRLGSHRNVTIRNFSRISGFYAGVELSGGSGSRVEDCVFDGCGRGVLVADGSITVAACTIRNAFIALESTWYAGGCTFTDNTIEDCVFSIRYANTPAGSCTGNTIARCCDRDIALFSGDPVVAGMLVERARPLTGDRGVELRLELDLRTPMAAASADASVSARVVPDQPVTIDRDGATLGLAFTPQRPGLHTVEVTVTDADDNRTTHAYPVQIGTTALRHATCTLQHDGPFYGQTPDRWDTGSMGFAAEPVEDDVFCGGWIQFETNDLPPSPVAVLEQAHVKALIAFKTDPGDEHDNRFGLQRLTTFDSQYDSVGDIPEGWAETAWPEYFQEWGEYSIDPVAWAMDERHAWHGVSVKMTGRFPFIRCGNAENLSRVVFDYRVPTTPEVTALDTDVRLLAATSAADGVNDAQLVLAGPADATQVVLADWPQAFLDTATTIGADTTTLDLASVGSEDAITGVPLWITTEGTATITVNAWDATTATRRWTLHGNGSAELACAQLAADTRYELHADDLPLTSCTSDADGALSLTIDLSADATVMALLPADTDTRTIILEPAPGDAAWQITPAAGARRDESDGTYFEDLAAGADYTFRAVTPPSASN